MLSLTPKPPGIKKDRKPIVAPSGKIKPIDIFTFSSVRLSMKRKKEKDRRNQLIINNGKVLIANQGLITLNFVLNKYSIILFRTDCNLLEKSPKETKIITTAIRFR